MTLYELISLISQILLPVLVAIAVVLLERMLRKQDEGNQVINIVHQLVNNDFGLALREIARLARLRAEQTGAEQDFDIADKAESRLIEHDKKQVRADEVEKKG